MDVPGPQAAVHQEVSSAPHEGPLASPYKFLNYFEEADQANFAGREDEVQRVLSELTRGRTYVLYSRSGLGKTSLLLAAVFPQLRQRGFHPLRVRLLESPVEDFCAALAAEFQRPELAQHLEPAERQALVPRVLGELSSHEPLVIVLDQFEEFFVRFREHPTAQAELVALLGHIYREQAANLRLVFCLREDYYAQLEDLRTELPELTQYGLRLLPFTAYGARQAIVRPLQHARVDYEETFVNRLVDMLAEWNFEPPVLQIVCSELYRDVLARRGPPVHLKREDVDRLGGVDGIVRAYVHRVTGGLDAERLLLVRVVLDALISSERTRYALRAEDLLSSPVRAGIDEVRAVLDHLTEQGLLRVERRKGERWFELLHERLMAIVDDWLATDVDYVRFRTAHKLVATLSEGAQWRTHPDWLLTAPQLQERVDPWKEQLRLTQQQAEFLLRSSIHGQADSVAGWAARVEEFGEGGSVKLVLELLDHPDSQVRYSAAASCGKLRDEAGWLATRCLALALEDPVQQVRAVARDSFVRLARPQEFAMLRRALEAPEHREPALELLAELLEQGRSLAGLPESWQRRAKAIIRARRLERERLAIRSRTYTGALAGAVSALVWSFTVGLVVAAYWVCTLFPEEMTLHWPSLFLSEMLWLIVDNVPFVFIPGGVLLGALLARLLARTAAVEGREDWRSSVLRSGALVISCVALHVMLLITTDASALLTREVEVHQQLGIPRWVITLTVLLVASALEWLETVGLVLLGSRCITRESKPFWVYLFAALASATYPFILASSLSMVAWWGGLQPGLLRLLFVDLVSSAAVVSSFQLLIILSVLASERRRREPGSPWSARLARAVILMGAPVMVLGFLSLHEPRTYPGLGRQYTFAAEVPLEGHTWQHEFDVEYFSLNAAPGGPFAWSIHDGHGSRTRLIIGGQEATNGWLLVSAWSRVTGAVGSEPGLNAPTMEPRSVFPRTSYHYLLRREPIQEGAVGPLQPNRWTLASLPLVPVNPGPGAPPMWHVSLNGQVSPARLQQGQGTHVLVLPVLVNIPEFEPGACMGVSSSTPARSEAMGTFALINQAGLGRVPPPGLQTEFFAEGLRLSPGEDGAWALTLTLAQLVRFHPRQCEPPPVQNPLVAEGWTHEVPDLYGKSPSLLVAVMQY